MRNPGRLRSQTARSKETKFPLPSLVSLTGTNSPRSTPAKSAEIALKGKWNLSATVKPKPATGKPNARNNSTEPLVQRAFWLGLVVTSPPTPTKRLFELEV